jgi:transposase-like protein
VKVRQAGRNVSVAVIIAVAVNTDGRREVLGMEVGPSEAEPFWTSFLRSLTRRGLRGVKLVISDSHEGLKTAAAKVLQATWQRCRMHFVRNALAHVGTKQRPMVAAAIRTAFTQESQDAARKEWRADRANIELRPRPTLLYHKPGRDRDGKPGFDFCFLDGSHSWEVDGLAFYLVAGTMPVGGLFIFDDLDWS